MAKGLAMRPTLGVSSWSVLMQVHTHGATDFLSHPNHFAPNGACAAPDGDGISLKSRPVLTVRLPLIAPQDNREHKITR